MTFSTTARTAILAHNIIIDSRTCILHLYFAFPPFSLAVKFTIEYTRVESSSGNEENV